MIEPYSASLLLIPSFISYEGHLTAKSDIYSFGVVLLEILTGQRVVDKNRPTGEQNLVPWAKPYLTSKRKVTHIMDGRIGGQYTVGAAHKAGTLANKCLSTDPKLRPEMNQVVKVLEHLQDLRKAEKVSNQLSLQKHHSR